ncbi:hypothetical protein HU200_030610 [Digitaria exilis]|uniref:Sororin C-terminal region domain-containing protein n=1 Tax=Digitaria exilis TaxID=1010633 RepID=A0A835BNI7_9POAL|nr:hypothetical protein HU200_030610 [Digitaria exilis]
MRPPTSAAMPPGPSSAIKRQRRAAAAPLSDVTNLLLPETPTPIKPARTRRAILPTPSAASEASSTCSSTASVTPAPNPSSAAGQYSPLSPLQLVSSAAQLVRGNGVFDPRFGAGISDPALHLQTPTRTAACSNPPSPRFTRGAGLPRLKGGGRGIQPPPPPPTRARNPLLLLELRVALLEELQGRPPGKTLLLRILGPFLLRLLVMGLKRYICAHLSDYLQYKQKRPPPSTPKLPEDFVKKQRAYFAEIDAFDLPVEEVSESELE